MLLILPIFCPYGTFKKTFFNRALVLLMKWKYCFFIITFILTVTLFVRDSHAQSKGNIHALPLPVGSGARALGQGGAFIAVADDATAASWNPGALMTLLIKSLENKLAYNIQPTKHKLYYIRYSLL